MKPFSMHFALITAITFLSLPVHLSASLIDGLVAFYPLNGNANDASGNGNHGTVFGATPTSDRFGTPSAAYEFNNNPGVVVPADEYISIPDSPSLRPDSALTITVWIKAAILGYQHIIAKTHSTAPGNSYVMWFDDRFDPNGYLRFALDREPNTAFISPIPTLNQWHHVAGVWDGALIRLYLGGIQVGSTPFSGPIPYDSNPLLIGADDDNFDGVADAGWTGAIDDVRIYNRVLSDSEIQQLASDSEPIPEPSTYLLFGIVILGLIGITYRRKKQSA